MYAHPKRIGIAIALIFILGALCVHFLLRAPIGYPIGIGIIGGIFSLIITKKLIKLANDHKNAELIARAIKNHKPKEALALINKTTIPMVKDLLESDRPLLETILWRLYETQAVVVMVYKDWADLILKIKLVAPELIASEYMNNNVRRYVRDLGEEIQGALPEVQINNRPL